MSKRDLILQEALALDDVDRACYETCSGTGFKDLATVQNWLL
jgi:hypothetical protein